MSRPPNIPSPYPKVTTIPSDFMHYSKSPVCVCEYTSLLISVHGYLCSYTYTNTHFLCVYIYTYILFVYMQLGIFYITRYRRRQLRPQNNLDQCRTGFINKCPSLPSYQNRQFWETFCVFSKGLDLFGLPLAIATTQYTPIFFLIEV